MQLVFAFLLFLVQGHTFFCFRLPDDSSNPPLTLDEVFGLDMDTMQRFTTSSDSVDPSTKCLSEITDVGAFKQEISERLVSVPHETFRRCSIVGSGGNLLDSGLGDEIDAHDVVVRLNHHPTRGFEKDVGAKTTIRIYYPESNRVVTEDEQASYKVLYPYKFGDFVYLEKALKHMGVCDCACCNFWWDPPECNPDFHNLTTFHNNFYELVYHHARMAGIAPPKHPSLGFAAFVAMVSVCEETSIYGTGFGDYRADGKIYCQYDGDPQDDCEIYSYGKKCVHAFAEEHAYYEEYASKAGKRMRFAGRRQKNKGGFLY